MKRFPRLLLFALLALSAVFWASWEAARLRAEQQLSRFLGVPVHVRRLTFTPGGLTLHKVSFELAGKSPLRIERLQVEGSPFSSSFSQLRSITLTGLKLSIAGVPLNAGGKVHIRAVPGSYAQVDGQLELKHPTVRGEAEIAGRLVEPVVFGWVETKAFGKRRFLSKLILSREAIGLQQLEVQGGWAATGNVLIRRPAWQADLSVIAPDTTRYRFRIEPGVKPWVRAKLSVYPEEGAPKEFFGQWAIERGHLEFEAQLLGRQGVLKGVTELQFPYRTTAALDLFSLDLDEIADWIPGQSSSNLSGIVKGRMEMSAFLGGVSSSGELVSRRGRFGRMDFEQMAVRFKGQGPLIQVHDSYLARRGTLALMEGGVDVRRIGKPDFFRNVKLSPAPDVKGGLELPGFDLGIPALPADQSVKLNLKKEEKAL